jgi:REP element-mobilizing transposase RayT
MARFARVVVPGIPHHITQRGNRRQTTFFNDRDYLAYIELMAEWCEHHDVEIWAYCLMPNHVHLVAVPGGEHSLRLAMGNAHRRYTRRVNVREGWTGHLWQGRFASFPMDERQSALGRDTAGLPLEQLPCPPVRTRRRVRYGCTAYAHGGQLEHIALKPYRRKDA